MLGLPLSLPLLSVQRVTLYKGRKEDGGLEVSTATRPGCWTHQSAFPVHPWTFITCPSMSLDLLAFLSCLCLCLCLCCSASFLHASCFHSTPMEWILVWLCSGSGLDFLPELGLKVVPVPPVLPCPVLGFNSGGSHSHEEHFRALLI